MDVAIGLPNAVPGTTGAQITEWARRAEARGFSSLGTIDRIAYDNYEPLTALAAAAAVTERIGLCTSVLLGPLRPNATELAKQALSVNALSGGRFVLGIGIGGREDDYQESGIEMKARGVKLDAALERIKEVWSGTGGIGPSVAGPPRLLVGGGVDASFARAARFGEGWIAGAPARKNSRRRREGQGRMVGGRSRGRAAPRRPRLLLARRGRRAPREQLSQGLLRLVGRGAVGDDRRLGRQGRRHGPPVHGRLRGRRLRRADLLSGRQPTRRRSTCWPRPCSRRRDRVGDGRRCGRTAVALPWAGGGTGTQRPRLSRGRPASSVRRR